MKKTLLTCLAAALLARAGLAVLTEHKPLFPAYYYTDAQLTDTFARGMAEGFKSGRPYPLPGSPSQRVQAAILAGLYLIAGPRPLCGKILAAVLGSAAVGALYFLLKPLFGGGPAMASALLLAAWPSHVFFTSQNFKDVWVMLLSYAALGAAVRVSAEELPLKNPAPAAAALFASLWLLGFFRAYLLITLAGLIGVTLAVLIAARLRHKLSVKPLILCLCAVLLAPPAYISASKAVFQDDGPLGVPKEIGDPSFSLRVIPASMNNETGEYIQPFSPQGISQMRQIRQLSDRRWAREQKGREIGSLLFFGLEFRTWLDVLLFMPKGLFYVLFMPLPFLYPIDNLGRWLASMENCLLLTVAALGILGAARRPKSPGHWLLLAFFAVMAAGSALLEFDLGSATRHRLLYMPMLFPFAAGLVERRRLSTNGRLKIFQVLECGGPGGTGNQVAALCNGLDPAKFDVSLVYAARGFDHEAYRRSASGAKNAYHVAEMTREISPLRDLTALIKLYRLFAREKPDVVHAHSSKAGVLARLAAWAAGVPKIYYSAHGYGFLQQDRSTLSRAAFRLAERAVSWIGEIAAVSPSEAALARELSWGKPVHTICDAYLGEPSPDGAQPEPGKILVGGCGRLTAARDPDAFIALSQRLTDSRNGLRCVWIGGGELEADVRRHLENMNLLSKVEVTGWLDAAAAQEKMKRLDVFVHYSRWDGLANAVLEAMALGLPVVASDIPGNRDAVIHGETGFLAKNEVELLEYSLKLVGDPALRRRLGDAGRQRVRQEFSRDKALAAFEALYLAPVSQSDTIA